MNQCFFFIFQAALLASNRLFFGFQFLLTFCTFSYDSGQLLLIDLMSDFQRSGFINSHNIPYKFFLITGIKLLFLAAVHLNLALQFSFFAIAVTYFFFQIFNSATFFFCLCSGFLNIFRLNILLFFIFKKIFFKKISECKTKCLSFRFQISSLLSGCFDLFPEKIQFFLFFCHGLLLSGTCQNMKFFLCFCRPFLEIFPLHIDHIPVSQMKIFFVFAGIKFTGKLLIFHSGNILIQLFHSGF